MRLVPTSMCRPGMKLAKKIFSQDGLVLLGENVELTERIIARLTELGIQFVYIADARTADVVLPELISEDTMRVALTEIRTNFREIMERPNRRSAKPRIFIDKPFRQMMNMVIDDLLSRRDAMVMLMNMSTVDHYLYQHSLNVCVYTTLLGIAHGYSRDELMTLGLGALLHDIGKTRIDPGVLKKNGSLTSEEYEEIKRHAELGYLILKDEPNIPLLAAHCAYQHHERLDGSGYPRGLKGDEIQEFAKWVGLVDSYDAMTTNRIYRSPMLPHHAMEQLYAGSGSLYEQRMLQLFRDKVAIYPIGLSVKLHTGESGVVVGIHSSCPHRPVVRVLYNEAGEALKIPYEKDLSRQLSVMIVGVDDRAQSDALAATAD